jgi:alginate O-acetyltransferase complex protein AlgI
LTSTDPSLVVWAAIFVAAAWLVPRRLRTTTMAAIGGLFLAFADLRSLAVLAALATVALGVMRSTRPNGLLVTAVVLVVTGTLISFKWGVTLNHTVAGLIPLGLSYYALRILHLIFEWSRHDREHFDSVEVIRYLLFFPTQLAGPINRFPDFARDSRRRRWDTALFAIGLERVLYGSVKIVVLANYLVGAKMAMYLETIPSNSWLASYLGCVQYGLNLYLQFSGYSDVAIGIALLAGYHVPENFNWPFVATDIHDFWNRWHITLSQWCRDYVFKPVAAVSRSPHLGVVAAMLVLGMWHELSLRYLLWGVYHGLGLVAWRQFQTLKSSVSYNVPRILRPVGIIAGWFLTMNFVILSFALTRAYSLKETWSIWATIVGW